MRGIVMSPLPNVDDVVRTDRSRRRRRHSAIPPPAHHAGCGPSRPRRPAGPRPRPALHVRTQAQRSGNAVRYRSLAPSSAVATSGARRRGSRPPGPRVHESPARNARPGHCAAPGRPGGGRAGGQERALDAGRRAGAQQGADIARILDAVEQHAILVHGTRQGRRRRRDHEGHALPALHAGQRLHQARVQRQAALGRQRGGQAASSGWSDARHRTPPAPAGRDGPARPGTDARRPARQTRHGAPPARQLDQRLDGRVVAGTDVFHASAPKAAMMGASCADVSAQGPHLAQQRRCSAVP